MHSVAFNIPDLQKHLQSRKVVRSLVFVRDMLRATVHKRGLLDLLAYKSSLIVCVAAIDFSYSTNLKDKKIEVRKKFTTLRETKKRAKSILG